VKCLLSEAADISRHEPAIVTADRRLLYHEFEERVLFAVAHLRAAGVARGSRVALWMENDWRYVLLIPAIIRLGAVVVPVNVRWPAKLVAEQLRRIGCKYLIAESDVSGCDATVLKPDALIAYSDESSGRHVLMDLNQPAAIVFTSGSSGSPRAALLSYGNLYYSALGSNQNIRLASHDRWLLSLPLYHVGGLGILFRCLQAGATIALPGAGESIEGALARFRTSHLSLVATQLFRLLRSEGLSASVPFVKAILLGGSAISPALFMAAREKKLPVFPSYGLTEMASQVTTVRPNSPPAKRETSGRLLRNRDLQIADDGEILVCGDTLFIGYVDEKGIDPARDENGWFHTGDIGTLDDDGYLTVRGRKDFMFISGGENIHPEEIESAIARLGEVEQSLVVPVDDAEFGQRPVAFLRGFGALPPPATLSARVGEWLPRFKIPVAYFPWPAEFDSRGKPDRLLGAQIASRLVNARGSAA
jgi:O-succinylbenzoic acid--CoA ligase